MSTHIDQSPPKRTRRSRKQLHPEIAALLAYVDGKTEAGFSQDLWGVSARACAIPLLQDWQLSLNYKDPDVGGRRQDLVQDVDRCIALLTLFREEAKKLLLHNLPQAESTPQASADLP